MKAYADYFDRLNIVINQNYDLDDVTVDLTRSGITREYYAKIDERSDAILDFFQSNIANQEVRNALKEIASIEGYRDNDDLMLCLLMDIVHCFDGLDHSTSLSTCEGIALLNVLEKVYRSDYYMSFDELSAVPSFIINLDAMVTYIFACIEATDIIKSQSIVSALLQKVNPEADKEYRILLYRFCEAISEVDGVISIPEREFLMNILRLDDNDANTDIHTDSIFSREKSKQ